MNKIAILFLLLIGSQLAVADSSTPALTIKSIATGWGNEGIYINTYEGEAVEGCTSGRLRVPSNHGMIDYILSMVLSAFHAKVKVIFRVSGCVGSDMNVKAVQITD